MTALWLVLGEFNVQSSTSGRMGAVKREIEFCTFSNVSGDDGEKDRKNRIKSDTYVIVPLGSCGLDVRLRNIAADHEAPGIIYVAVCSAPCC